MTRKIDLQWGVKIPMRDGVELNATVYLSRGWRERAPCIVTVTPYISDTYHDRGLYFAANGFPFVIVDSRGRGNSGGVFRPSIQEAHDGYDVIEWVARQRFCNGKVGMWGGSYAGYGQWATAKERPPHLGTIVPAAAAFPGIDFPMRNNIFQPYAIQWLMLTSGWAAQARMFDDAAFWAEVYRDWHESGRPFRELDMTLGSPCEIFQEWIVHPEPDAYWDACSPTQAQYATLDIPILSITGIYDDDQIGALEHYRRHTRHAATHARHFLVIGPWDHAGTRTPQLEFGGIRVGRESLIDLGRLHLEWYEWTLEGGARPAFLKDAVMYYVMVADRWRHAGRLEEVTARYVPFFLDSVGRADDVFSSGSLSATPGTGQPDTYRYDPRETGGPEVQAEARLTGTELTDQTVMLALHGRALFYHTAPLERDLEISGFFRLSAWIAIDCPDTDIYVSVYDIDCNGGSVRLSTDAIRARYRESLRVPRLVSTREPLRYDFERFTFVSRLIRKGHRLRLMISPVGRVVDAVFTQKNYNGGGLVAEESADDGRPVHVAVYHDEAHPSALYVPVGRSD